MVSPMGGNVRDDNGWDDKVISIAMEAGLTPDMVKMCKCLGVREVMCKPVRA